MTVLLFLFLLFRLRRMPTVLAGKRSAVMSIFLPAIPLFCTKWPSCGAQIFNGHHDSLRVPSRAIN